MADYEEGYEDSRFEKEVDRNLHCPICMNILKDPVQCHRQHLFCSPCIQRHLQHSQTCPTCREDLTKETLAQPPRIVTEWLSVLKIRCDFADRGCRELVELEFFKRHVERCGYSPSKCENDGCPMIINKNDKENHENHVCGFRKVKCDDCGEEELFKKFKTHGCVLKKEMDEVKMNLNRIKDELGMMRQQMQCNQDEIMQDVRGMTTGMMAEMKELVNNATKQATEAIMQEVRGMTAGMMAEMKELVNNATKQANEETKYIKQIIDGHHRFDTRENIVVAGGHDGKSRLNSVERFSCIKGTWEPVQSMKQQRHLASSFVYQQQMFVAGGRNDDGRLDSLERLNINEELGEWLDVDAKLPVKVSGHANVVYKNRLIVTGGYTDKGVVSDGISEILLTWPYSSKLLGKMTQPRAWHCSQLFDDKIMIFGGKKTWENKESFDSVLLYNITSNKCEQKAPLPFAANGMASVSLNDNVFLMGGSDKNGNVLNTIVKYDVKTGKSELLPPMKYKRYGCAAVVTGNVVVVMGGRNMEQGYLNSVEYFNLDSYAWKELPPMIEKRWHPTAVVKPVV